MTNTMSAADLVAEAKASIENLDPDRFAEEATRDDVVVVDIRETEERHDGTIAGAIHVPRGMLEFRADPTSPYHDERLHPDRRVLLHCASGGRSALAARALERLGYTDVAHLDGGMVAWREQGHPVAAAPSPY